MIDLKHLSENELSTVEVEVLLFEKPEMMVDATPQNMQVIVDRINELISVINTLRNENKMLRNELTINKLFPK